MARRRELRPEEKDIWDQVARTARAMHARRPVVDMPATVEPVVRPAPALPMPMPVPVAKLALRAPLASKASPKIALDLAPSLGQILRDAPLQMDANTHKSLRKGKVMPEARLDLHGLTLAEAHPELIRFILNAHSDGRRLVLVITGKGKDRDYGGPIPSRVGALRHQVPHWLRLPPLGSVILQVTQAHLRHGGEGAYYVYLRRTR